MAIALKFVIRCFRNGVAYNGKSKYGLTGNVMMEVL